jgi:hypothetical protein
MVDNGFSLAALLLYFIFDSLQVVQLAANQKTTGTLFCQCQSDRFPNSPAGTGYQDDFVFQ